MEREFPIAWPGTEKIDQRHLYRAKGLLGKPCPNQEHRMKLVGEKVVSKTERHFEVETEGKNPL